MRARWAAIGAACAVALGGGGFGVVRAVVDDGERAIYVAIEPTRILDTRSGSPISNSSMPLVIEGTITPVDGITRVVVPEDASAVALNITVTEGRKRDGYGYVTAYPCTSADDAPPNASSLNFENAIDIANGLNVTTSSNGTICFYVWGTADLIVDVVGYYADHNHDDLYPRWEDMSDSLSGLQDQEKERPMPNVAVASGDGQWAFDIDAQVATSGRAAMVMRVEPGGGSNSRLDYYQCADFACDGHNLVPLTSLGGDPMEPALEYDRGGTPVIVYYDSASPYGLRLSRCRNLVCSETETPLVLTTGIDNGREPEVITTTSGRLLIASRVGTGINSRLQFSRVVCDTDCVNVGAGALLSRGGYDPTLVVDPQGIPFVVHFRPDGINSKVHLERCDDDSCTSATNMWESTGWSSGDAILDANGFLLIALVSNNQLRISSCLTWNCAAGPSNILTGTSNIAGMVDISLALGADGRPVGAYSDQPSTERRLVYVKCSTTNCLDNGGFIAAHTQVQTSVFGQRGSFADVIVESNGYPVIFDQVDFSPAGGKQIGITSCANPYCLPWIRTP